MSGRLVGGVDVAPHGHNEEGARVDEGKDGILHPPGPLDQSARELEAAAHAEVV